jgi:hypothetical protein
MHSTIRALAFVIGTSGVAALVACSGSDGAPDSTSGGATEVPSTTATSPSTTATQSQATPPPASTTTSTTSTTSDAGPEGGSGAKALGETCAKGTDCASGVCYVGGQSSYCSLTCTSGNAATVCVPPTFNGVCNKQGFCRKP